AGLANVAVRSLQDWLLVTLAVGMPHLVFLFRDAAQKDRRRPWVAALLRADRACRRALGSPLFRFQPGWPAVAFAALRVFSLPPSGSRKIPRQDAPEWPGAAVNAIEHQGLCGRFFAPADYGAYLTWRLGDRARCYVDTRGFFFPPALIEDSHFIP